MLGTYVPAMIPGDSSATSLVIGAAIEVHRILGPGLLESAYEECLAIELGGRRLPFTRQTSVPVSYKGVCVAAWYRVDFVFEELVVEVKAVERLLPVHEAQLLTYMRLLERPVGLLLNFNSAVLKDGIRRMSLKG